MLSLNAFKDLNVPKVFYLTLAFIFGGFAPLSRAATAPAGSVQVAWDPVESKAVTGYRLYIGTESRSYTRSIDVGLATEAEIPGLPEGQLHYCAVTSYSASGLESDYSEELPIVYEAEESAAPLPGGSLIVMEATGSSLGLEIPADAAYYVWARIYRTDSDLPELSATIGAGLSAGSPAAITTPVGALPEGGTWTWVRVPIGLDPLSGAYLSAGAHHLQLEGLTGGTYVGQIVLSSSPDYVPERALPSFGTAVDIARQPPGFHQVYETYALTFGLEAVATGHITYQWFKDGYLVPGQNGPALVIDAATSADTGSYVAIVMCDGRALATTPTWVQVDRVPLAVQLAEAPLSVAALRPGENDAVEFEIHGGVGKTLSVFASDDLLDWEKIGKQINTDGGLQIADPARVERLRRFYRVEAP